MCYCALFLLCISSVAGLLPWKLLLVLAAAALLILDRNIFRRVDYSLLLTFAGFFIFIGNMSRIPAFRKFISGMVSGREVLTGVAASQLISNVPAALLLSGFTSRWEGLIIGTNLGGLGTLIASMASLISYKQIARLYSDKRSCYLGVFTAANLIFLLALLAVWKIGLFS